MRNVVLLFIILFIFSFLNVYAEFTDSDKAQLSLNNLYSNGGAESRLKGWSETGGGTLAIEKTTKRSGKAAIKFTSSAASDYLNFPAVVVKKGTNNCEAIFYYKTTSAVWDAEVYINSNRVAVLDLPSNTEFTKASVTFVCTDFTNNTQVKLTNGAASDIVYVDDAEIGENKNVGSVNLQDKRYNISSYVTASPSFSTLDYAYAWPYKDRDGNWRLKFQIAGTLSSTVTTVSITISGATLSAPAATGYDSIGIWKVGGGADAGTLLISGGNVYGVVSTATVGGSGFFGDTPLTGKPTWATDYAAEQVVRAENANTFGAAYWSAAQFSVSAGSWTTMATGSTYTPTNYNNAVGAASAYQIATTNLKASTTYKITANSAFATSTSTTCQFRIYDGTSSLGSIELSASGTPYNSISSLVGYVSYTTDQPTRTFYVQAQKTSGADNCYSSANSTSAVLSIEPVYPTSAMPQIVNSVSSTSNKQTIFNSVRLAGATDSTPCTGSPCTQYNETGDWVSSVSRDGQGIYTINMNAGIYPNKPVCVCSTASTTDYGFCQITPLSTSQLALYSKKHDGTFMDETLLIMCHGEK